MIFLIDNEDSFTYNIFQYLKEITPDVQVIRVDAFDHQRIKANDHLILSPGPGHPRHANALMNLIKNICPTTPVLGICLGHQALAQHYGARIIGAKHIMHGKTSAITHAHADLFQKIPSPFQAMRYHSLVIDTKHVPETLTITATSDDHEIMAFQHKHYPHYGIQFHPESILSHHGKVLLHQFVQYNGRC
jgi:anthranilate synthase component 2